MSVFVKICGVRDAATAQAAADAGADALGFVFAESVRRVTPGEASAAAQELPRGIKRIAVMRHPSNDEWLRVLDVFHPDALQTDIEDFDALNVPDSVARWPVVRETEISSAVPDLFVYEGADSGTGETVDWSQAARIADGVQMILAGGLAPENVDTAIRQVRPWGVDVSSGVESEPGVKDAGKIKAFIGAVRAAEKEV